MYLLAVSGGPDSMCLLNAYKHKKIVVAHVKYNQRPGSLNDARIVKKFCDQNQIPVHVLNVTRPPQGNFQHWARTVRYNFFKQLYGRFNCQQLVMAHHKDDFLETALMQQKSGRNPRFFGIKKQNVLNGMKIYRPYVDKHWKAFLVQQNKRHNVTFAVDSSNHKPIYTRNQVRLELAGTPLLDKERMFASFVTINKVLSKKFKRIDQRVKAIRGGGHQLQHYRQLEHDARAVIYEIIHQELGGVKLSTTKIDAIWAFVNGREGNKQFVVNNKACIYKKAGQLEYILL